MNARSGTVGFGLLLVIGVPACADDPEYIDPQLALEVGTEASPGPATASITLPIRLETTEEAADRATLAAQLGVQVPFVRREDLEVEVEWTMRNLDPELTGTARIGANAANEWFVFDPQAFVIDPQEDEPPPPLMGGIPVEIGPGETRSGVMREDQIREASIDLELITRGGVNPVKAELEVDEDMAEFPSAEGGAMVPAEAFAGIVRFDLVFSADAHMVLECVVRVRDHRGLLHKDLLAAPAAELTVFAPAVFAPAPAPMP